LGVAPVPARIVPVAALNPPPVMSPWLPDSVANERVRLPPKLSIDPRPAGWVVLPAMVLSETISADPPYRR